MSKNVMPLSCGPVAGRLDGKTVLITGAGGGVGRAASILFAQAGATVVGADINSEGLRETTQVAQENGVAVDLSTIDLTDADATRRWVDNAAINYGGLDVLYNNAGGARFAPVADLSVEDWHATLRMELDVLFFPTRAVWDHLVGRGGGSIINTASLSGMRATESLGATAHAAAKGGVIGITPHLAMEGAPHNIRVNTISPGPLLTPPAEAAMSANPAFREVFEGRPLLNRVGRAVDIAYAALFLASEESMFITGANLLVDGGWGAKGGLTRH